MSLNPYYTEDADDDLFEETDVDDEQAHGHALDGTTCRKCYRIHSMDGLPTEGPARDQMIAMMRMFPEHMLMNFLNEGDFNSHIPTRIAYGWLKGASQTQESGSAEPLRRAIGELLDEMTGGRLTALWKVYESERQVMVNQHILKLMNESIQWMRDKDTSEYSENSLAKFSASLHVADFICELVAERVVSSYNKYKMHCSEADVEPEKQDAISSLAFGLTEIDDPIVNIMLRKLEFDIKTRF